MVTACTKVSLYVVTSVKGRPGVVSLGHKTQGPNQCTWGFLPLLNSVGNQHQNDDL